jgi:hypothetical protein
VGSEEVWRRQSVLFAEGGRLQQVALLGLRPVALACHHQHWLLAVNEVFLKQQHKNYYFLACLLKTSTIYNLSTKTLIEISLKKNQVINLYNF